MGLEERITRLEERINPPRTEDDLIAVYYTDNGAAPEPGAEPDYVVYFTNTGERLPALPAGLNPDRIKAYGPGMEDV